MEHEKIINIGIVAHVDAGKTTLTEQLLYRSGSLRKKGSVDEGTAKTDWLSIERTRGISVKSSSVRIEKENCAINIIDTPGHVDFNGEVERCLSILDCAVLLISAVEGIQAQTELLYEALCQTKIPTILLLNKIDRAGSNVAQLMQAIQSQLTPSILPFQTVQQEGEKNCTIQTKNSKDPAFFEECMLALSEVDPTLLETYLSGVPVSGEMIEEKFKSAFHQATIFPVLCSSASLGIGVDELLAFLIKYAEGTVCTKSDPLSAIVYKIEHDKTMGKIAHVRMFGGTIKNRDSLYLPSAEKSEKVTQIRRVFGEKFTDIGEVHAGDIAALCGLSSVQIGDVIGESGKRSGYPLAVPLLKVQVLPDDKKDQTALLSALRELCEEDPLLALEYHSDEQEIQIKITGQIQLEIITALLLERYQIGAHFSDPSVIYKETPLKMGIGFDAYTMPKPCWAVVRLQIEPGLPESGLAYSSVVPNNAIFFRYQNHIKTSVQDTLKQGLYGWEVTDLKVTLIGGEHHTVHTHPMDFFVATPTAVMDGLQNAGTTLLEPIITVRISAQKEFLSKIIGDLVQMRGEVDSPVIQGDTFKLEANLPVATSLDYPVKLAILTSGRALISTRFAGYQACPLHLGSTAKRRGVHPLDRAKWILTKRNAMQE